MLLLEYGDLFLGVYMFIQNRGFAVPRAENATEGHQDQSDGIVKKLSLAIHFGAESLERSFQTMVLSEARVIHLSSKGYEMEVEQALAAIEEDPYSFSKLSLKLRDNEKIALRAVSKNGFYLRFVSSRLKKSPKIVGAAVKCCLGAWELVDEKLKKDKDFVLEIIKEQYFVLMYLPEFCKNKDFMKKATEANPLALRYCPKEITGDEKIAKKAIRRNGLAWEFLGFSLRGKKDLALMAANQNPLVLRDMPDAIKTDKLVKEVLKKHGGRWLLYATYDQRDNPEIVNLAMKTRPDLFRLASDRLQYNPELLEESKGCFSCFKKV